jgi:hypothetical protein
VKVTVSSGEIEHWVKRLAPAAAGFALAGLLAPGAALGAVAVVVIAALWARNPFAGVGLGAAMLPFGAWLVEHPGPLRLAGVTVVGAAMLWWYWRDVQTGVSS